MVLWQWIASFVAAAALLAWAGSKLTQAADEIAERSGLGRVLVGMLLVAAATSLPELLTDVSAAVAGSPDLATADLFGSSMANMAILAALDLTRRGRFWPRVELDHARVGTIAICLTAAACLAILTGGSGAIGWIGTDTIGIAAAYVAAVAWIRRSPQGRLRHSELLPTPVGWASMRDAPVRTAVLRFGGAAVGVVVAAPLVALAARGIAREADIAESFLGVVLLAGSTSLPELVASFAALRIGAHDLAVGNLFGSNAVNMALFVFVDAAYRPGPILAAVTEQQAIAGVGAVLLMGLALTAIVHGVETRVRRLEPDAVVVLVAYAVLVIAIWRVGVAG